MSLSMTREREQDDTELERIPKRTRVDDSTATANILQDVGDIGAVTDFSESTNQVERQHLLPSSHVLLGVPPPISDGHIFRILEKDVGISEYVGRDVPSINGIIKQRFTDFLVNEVDLDSQVVHIKSLRMPESEKRLGTPEFVDVPTSAATGAIVGDGSGQGIEVEADQSYTDGQAETIVDINKADNYVVPVPLEEENIALEEEPPAHDPWPEHFTSTLANFLSEDAVNQVKNMYLEGREPARVSDNGWGGRLGKSLEDTEKGDVGMQEMSDIPQTEPEKNRRRKNRGGRGSGGRRGGGGRGRAGGGREDERKVLSDPISSKATRTALHQAIRELFGGKLESEIDISALASDEGSRIIIRWSKSGGGRDGGRSNRGNRGERAPRGTYPPYIHFTLQKTNRDTQDALGYLSRILHVNVRDLSVAGTKDKRGVTVQRVSLKRGTKTVEDVWNLANGQSGRKSLEDAFPQRGERGVRIADLNYRSASLELGMLKGNAFLITLRNVQVDSPKMLDRALNSIKHKGFINYYGMQRFGTASVPTHAIGLALLKSDWHKAVSLILQMRPGEHPDVAAARKAWLVEGDLNKALELMPRRVVAERCILESYNKQGGETRNAMGALSTIPRNLRLMYVHAYQSYVWNAIVSERIRAYGSDNPVSGDLVYENDKTGDVDMAIETEIAVEGKGIIGEPEEDSSTRAGKKSRKPWVAPRVKALTDEDLDKYTIFDVVMPLPGKDVSYPGGALGERYREFLQLDGLDPDNFVRKQKEYCLSGSYRTILHQPKELSWSILQYTDPDVPLAQSDEDKLLGFDAPALAEDGKFMALQVNMILGTAAYATMALREVTKTETSSHFQSNLTQMSEDQKFRGALEMN